jgi:dihydroorotate dehydrogenase electron transfer subunit
MSLTPSRILEIRLEGENALSASIACPLGIRPEAGQYLLADRVDDPEDLPTPIFSAGWSDGRLQTAPPLPASWKNGGGLRLRGPFGRGFHIPALAHRIAAACLEGPPHRLLPLLELAANRSLDVALYTDAPPAGLPRIVEVLPLEQLAEAPAWADYLALDAPLNRLGDLPALLGLAPRQRCTCTIETLVYSPMPCGGAAECAICGFETRSGWKLACKDGPVFAWADLEVL